MQIAKTFAKATLARAALPLAALLAIAVAAHAAAGHPDLTGAWTIDQSRSDDPALAQKEHSSGGGSGVARQVVRGISVFGIPVGQLPVPAGHDPEPLKADALPGAEQVLSPVTRLRILQDGAATEFDYGGSLLAVYKDGARAEARDGTVHAAWNGDAFEVEHRFDGGTKITETYKLAASGEELHWVVHLKQKGADAIAIERVFERDGAR